MKTPIRTICAVLILNATDLFAQPALTIYNQNFAVVRDTIRLELRQGITELRYSGAAVHLEPDSVVLRDPAGKRSLQILEQNFRNDPVSQELMLSLFEGKTIDFETTKTENGQTKKEIISGKIVRSGYAPHHDGMSRYGSQYSARQSSMAYGNGSQPIIEVEGKWRFSLPGLPLFPTLGEDAVLKPTLAWTIQSDRAGRLDAEMSYVTGGMSWEADYNIVAPEIGDTLDLVGWVTMDNQSGKSFEQAKIKLLAGDVNKIREEYYTENFVNGASRAKSMAEPAVTEKTFDEYHLYTLQRPTTLLDRETKQVEFVRSSGIKSTPLYIYDGLKVEPRFRGWDYDSIRNNREYGTQSNPSVWVMREFSNAQTNRLGMPLPKGRIRFYRRDTDGQMEFTGENVIDHTPRDEMIRVSTGTAFDLVGSRTRTNYKVDDRKNSWADESFEIKLRNHKKTPVVIRVVEHLYRWTNWEIVAKSDAFEKTDAQTVEFRVEVKPDEEKTVSYTVHYSW